MNIAVLSGKGGTGKTTVSTNLAIALNSNYIDGDVEEPNGFIFLNPRITNNEKVYVDYPIIDKEKCSGCGVCVNTCQFNAIAKVKDNILLFDKLCHSCGACQISCKSEAISYSKREIGVVEESVSIKQIYKRGLLNIGEPMAVPIIKHLLSNLPNGVNVIDCPPGTSCNVVNSLKYVNGAILVTEPTEFGLHDLKMAVSLVRKFKVPFGVIVNKSNDYTCKIEKYCKEENIQLIGKIPYSKEAAQIYSKGQILYKNKIYKKVFDEIASNIREVLIWN